MGADLYIKKLHNPRYEAWWPKFQAACKERDKLPKGSPEEAKAQEKVNEYYGKMYEKGRFRDSYNCHSVMWRLGLSWSTDVTPMLNKRGNLDVHATRSLLEMVESREVRELEKGEKDFTGKVDDGENSTEKWNEGWKEGKAELILFLKTAIKLKAPIRASL